MDVYTHVFGYISNVTFIYTLAHIRINAAQCRHQTLVLDFHTKRRNATERDSQTWQIHFVQDRPQYQRGIS